MENLVQIGDWNRDCIVVFEGFHGGERFERGLWFHHIFFWKGITKIFNFLFNDYTDDSLQNSIGRLIHSLRFETNEYNDNIPQNEI